MKPRPEIIGEKVELLGLFGEVSPEEMESARIQALKHFESATGPVVDKEVVDANLVRPALIRRRPKWLDATAIAAAIAIVVLIPAALLHRSPAVFQDTRGSRPIQFGEVVRANDSAGSTLVLADKSRVEMRSKAEFSIERATDGIRIHLRKGSLIVNAAKQHAGHLYVQTKDVIVSVVGTVFLVNAEEEGSRVAVIEGEVHVKQGTKETKLGPGEQMTTNPKMESLSVKDELAWSSQSVTHVALLEQAATNSAAKGPRFEVVSIRSAAPAAPAGPGARGGNGDANSRPSKEGCSFGSLGYTVQLDPRRLAVTRVTVFHLIAWAYPVPSVPAKNEFNACRLIGGMGLISGGPEWIKTDMWDIQAGIPEGNFSSKPNSLDPKIQQMLQKLLAERVGLSLHRETREMPVYVLAQTAGGVKFNGRRPLDPGQRLMINDADGNVVEATREQETAYLDGMQGILRIAGTFDGMKVTMGDLAQEISRTSNRPVFDRTALTGTFDFHLDMRAPAPQGTPRGTGAPIDLGTALQTIGLKLEESKAPIDVWVIDRVEKPTEN